MLKRCLFLFAIIASSIGLAGPAAAQQHVRQSLHEFVQDQDKLISLLRGVLVMKQRNAAPKDSADYRRSWEYWAAIHGYPGPNSPNGTVQDLQDLLAANDPDHAPLYAGFFAGLQDMEAPAQPAGLAEKVWATCEHGTVHFFSWHRMYLYFFERVLREASGDPDFALPYWDYTNPMRDPAAPANAPARIPSIFVIPTLNTTSGPLDNPLYEKRRTSGFGDAVHLDVSQTNVDSVLDLDDFEEFQASLDQGLHGFIHCAVGNSCLAPYIGLVPFSGNDPIFWHHHANVDRLWQCWTQRYGKDANPTGDAAWMDQEFSFVDETGAEVSMKVAELFDPAGRIDYTYDNIDNCSRAAPPPAPPVAIDTDAPTFTAAVANAEAVRVTEPEQVLRLATADGGTEAMLPAARPNVIQPATARLRLTGVSAERPPGASILVYLADETGERRSLAGTMSFFSAFGHQHHGDTPSRDFVFDVSKPAQELFANDVAPAGFSIVIVASSGLTGEAAPAAGGAERYRNAGLAIGQVTLEVEGRRHMLDLQ